MCPLVLLSPQSLSAAICFFYSTAVPLYYQLLILIIFAVLGTLSFWRVELGLRRSAAAPGTFARRSKMLLAAVIAAGLLAARVYSGTVIHKHPPKQLPLQWWGGVVSRWWWQGWNYDDTYMTQLWRILTPATNDTADIEIWDGPGLVSPWHGDGSVMTWGYCQQIMTGLTVTKKRHSRLTRGTRLAWVVFKTPPVVPSSPSPRGAATFPGGVAGVAKVI